MKIHNTEVIITTAPGVFGDGNHDSTRNILDALYDANPKNKRVLDVGTGSGILSIFAKKWGASEVLAVDINIFAIQNARDNFKNNNVDVSSRLNIYNELLDYKADIIVANLPAHNTREFILVARETLKDDGILICTFPEKFNFFNECDLSEYDVVKKYKGSDWSAFVLKLK